MAKTLKFEDKMNRLAEIVNQLDSDELELSESIKIYEEGLALSKILKEELKSFEEKVEKIAKENANV